eukprot:c2529_g1_i1.p1 GENE.c2529_g1_i1~~c2529_g1_i1.p1  ORF type:complete len:531 (-),score=131.05 c2529_g1_i1:90-1637(-)
MSTPAAGFERIRREEAPSGATLDAAKLVADVRKVFMTGKTATYEWRLQQLKQIERMTMDRCDDIMAALKKDLSRPALEALLGDVNTCIDEVRFAIANLQSWMKPESVSHPVALKPGSSTIVRQPKGVALIIGAWNFSIQLTILPLISAVSAGCCAIIKPSEMSPNSAKLIEEMVNQYLDTSAIRVVQGAVAETTALLNEQFDHIMYTGNSAVAKVVMAAASKHLTPVTLELGGKSPAILDSSADLKTSIKRILGGRFFNTGQVCIAPDYLIVLGDSQRQAAVSRAIKATIHEMFGDDPKKSDSFGRIVNERHWDRIISLIEGARGDVICGGRATADRDAKYIPPTVIWQADTSSAVMQEEIFGPVLPVIMLSSLNEAVNFVNARARPLALYVFSNSQKTSDTVINNTCSGSVCVNDTLFQVCNPHMPFGGIGPSGMGSYHGRYGFLEFSHQRAIMSRPTWVDPDFRYPPYKEHYVNLIKKFLVKGGLLVLTKRIAQAGSIIALAVAITLIRSRMA